jgi:hypothetical protein
MAGPDPAIHVFPSHAVIPGRIEDANPETISPSILAAP